MKMRAIPEVMGFVAYLLLHGATQTLADENPCIKDTDDCADKTKDLCPGKMCVNYNCGYKCVARECPPGYKENTRTKYTFGCECKHQNCSVDEIWFGATDLRPRKMREGNTQMLFTIYTPEVADVNYSVAVDTSQSTRDYGVTLATKDSFQVIAGLTKGMWVVMCMLREHAVLRGYQDFTVILRLNSFDHHNNKTSTVEYHVVTIVSRN